MRTPRSRVIQDRICRKTGSNVVVDYDLNEAGYYQMTCYGCGKYANVDTYRVAVWLASDPHSWGCICGIDEDEEVDA